MRRAGEVIRFYGDESRLGICGGGNGRGAFVLVEEDGIDLFMPILPGDELGLWNNQFSDFEQVYFTGKMGKITGGSYDPVGCLEDSFRSGRVLFDKSDFTK